MLGDGKNVVPMNWLCACLFISTTSSQSVNQKPLPHLDDGYSQRLTTKARRRALSEYTLNSSDMTQCVAIGGGEFFLKYASKSLSVLLTGFAGAGV